MSKPAPAPQQGRDFGQQIRDAAQGIANKALLEAQREIEQNLGERRVQRAGLEDALRSTQSRPARLDIQNQIERLDREILGLEQAVQKINSRVGQAEQAPPAQTFTEQRPPFDPRDFQRGRIDPQPIVATTLGILFVAFPLTLALVRFIWKRSTSAPAPAMAVEQARRFDRLEQSVDAIAIEVERVSENQRYLTKLLAEPKQSAKIGS